MSVDHNAFSVLLSLVPPEQRANRPEWLRSILIKGRQLGWSDTHRKLLVGEEDAEA